MMGWWHRITSLVVAVALSTIPTLRAEDARPRLGELTDNYPFSFRAENGEIQGFAHDLMREVETVMALDLERIAGPTNEINPALLAGRVDLLQSLAQSQERAATMDFSFPYLTMEGAIIVRADGPEITSLADLQGLKVAVHAGSLGEALLRRAGLDASIRLVASVQDSLLAVERGTADATLASRLSGLALAHHLGLKRLRALPIRLENYEVRYCVAVRKGDSQLLARVNEGLAILTRTGRFDAIHQKWFGAIEPSKYTAEEVALGVAAGLALAFAVALWAGLRQRSLRLKIARQAEALRLSEESHRTIFEGARDALIVLAPPDPAGDRPVEQLNPAARRLLGLGENPPPATLFRTLLPEEDALHRLIAAALAEGQGTVTEEYALSRAKAWWRVTVSPLGRRTLLALADITEATEAREKLRIQEERMRQSQKLEAIGTLAGGVAHDFNNLLTAIMGNTELAQMQVDGDRPEAKFLHQTMTAARRARQIVKQILTFSRQSQPTRERLQLSPIIEETASFLRTVARGAVEIEHVRAAHLPPIIADSAQVHQVLMNIGTNAVHAMREHPGVLTLTEEDLVVGAELQAQHPGLKAARYVRIGVRDTGAGMSQQVLERIFEPFFTTKAKGDGTGLGLAVVHGIMEKHGGAVTVYSQPGRGTLFHLYFPAAPETTATHAPNEEPVAPGDGKQVLLVDDDPVILAIAEAILVRLGYRVSAHTRPGDALTAFTAPGADFAAVVTDLSMPALTGRELAAQLRAVRPTIPIVLTSGFFSAAEEADAETLGISVLLHKPLTYAGLGRAVARALDRSPRTRAPLIVG